MNERIKQLAEQANLEIDPAYPDHNQKVLEKFAELIVKECADTLRTEMYRLDAIPGREVSAQAMETAQVLIKNRFGVE